MQISHDFFATTTCPIHQVQCITVACRGPVMPGRLRDCMPPYQILILNSGVSSALLLDIRCLWRHNMTSYSRLQTNAFPKFV